MGSGARTAWRYDTERRSCSRWFGALTLTARAGVIVRVTMVVRMVVAVVIMRMHMTV
jgi:hypothetical protein